MAKNAKWTTSHDGGGGGGDGGRGNGSSVAARSGTSRSLANAGESLSLAAHGAKKAGVQLDDHDEDDEDGVDHRAAAAEEEEEEEDDGDAEMQDVDEDTEVAKSLAEDARAAGEDSDDYPEGGAVAAAATPFFTDARANPMANAVPRTSFFHDYPWLSGGGGGNHGTSSSRSGATGMVPTGTGGYAVGLSGSGSYTSCVHRHFVLPIPTEDDETYLVVKSVVEERTRAALAAEQAAHLERTVERLQSSTTETNRRAETSKSDASNAVQAAEEATSKWKDLVRRRDEDLSTAEETYKGQVRHLQDRNQGQLESQTKSLEEKAAQHSTLKKVKETATTSGGGGEHATRTPDVDPKKRKKADSPDASGSTKSDGPTETGASHNSSTPEAKRSRPAAAGGGVKSPSNTTTGETKDATGAKQAFRRQSTSDFGGWGASAAEIASTEATATAGASGTKADTPSVAGEVVHRPDGPSGAGAPPPVHSEKRTAATEPGEADVTEVPPVAKKEKKKKKKKKREAARRADLEKVESNLDDLNRTKSQMIWLLKQVITAEKTRKDESDKSKAPDGETPNAPSSSNNKGEAKKS